MCKQPGMPCNLMQESTYGQSRNRAGEDAFDMKNPRLETTKRRNLNEMQQPAGR